MWYMITHTFTHGEREREPCVEGGCFQIRCMSYYLVVYEWFSYIPECCVSPFLCYDMPSLTNKHLKWAVSFMGFKNISKASIWIRHVFMCLYIYMYICTWMSCLWYHVPLSIKYTCNYEIEGEKEKREGGGVALLIITFGICMKYCD